MHYIEKVNLDASSPTAYPHMLSGGMKQRVAIARGMAMEPEVLLMDEPFAALDALTRRKMQDELLQLWDDTRFTVLFVTHSIAEAVKIGNRILLLSPHPGPGEGRARTSGRATSHGCRARGETLERSIHDMLFADDVEEEVTMTDAEPSSSAPEFIREAGRRRAHSASSRSRCRVGAALQPSAGCARS